MLLSRSGIALLFSTSLLLASCANGPLGESLQKALAPDPKLKAQTNLPSGPPGSPTAPPTTMPSATPTGAPGPTSSPTTTPAATSANLGTDPGHAPAGPPQPATASRGLSQIKAFSDRLLLGLSGDSTGNAPAAQPSLTGTAATAFIDLEKTPSPLRSAVQDVVQLGLLTPPTAKGTTVSPHSPQNSAPSSPANPASGVAFEPNQPITRRDYARWLLLVNNRLMANRPAQQLRLGGETATPAFQDVPRSDADFATIQGLAEAGLIPSPLSGDSTTVVFRPNEPLTRETLLLWKVPIDMRQVPPTATIEAVKQTWGFQDTPRIDPRALRAVLADFQNGEMSNIRRVFGYTTLFQPKKPVTRAEAAAALWYVGFQGEGRSAQAALNSDG